MDKQGIETIATTMMAREKLASSSYPSVEREAGWKIAKGLFGGCGNTGEGVG